MPARLVTASLFALLSFSSAPPVAAADLGGSYDPGYAEDYEAPPSGRYRAEDYDEDGLIEERRRHAWSGRDADGEDDEGEDDVRRYQPSRKHHGYLAPFDRRPRFNDPPPRARYGCAEPWQIKRRLRAEGWRGFRDVALEGPVAVVRATQIRAGRSFNLRIDRCTGEIVSARPLPWRSYGAFEPRRYRPAY